MRRMRVSRRTCSVSAACVCVCGGCAWSENTSLVRKLTRHPSLSLLSPSLPLPTPLISLCGFLPCSRFDWDGGEKFAFFRLSAKSGHGEGGQLFGGVVPLLSQRERERAAAAARVVSAPLQLPRKGGSGSAQRERLRGVLGDWMLVLGFIFLGGHAKQGDSNFFDNFDSRQRFAISLSLEVFARFALQRLNN